METTEETQLPDVVDQAVEHHEKKTPQESFAELRRAKEDLERQLWQAQKEKELIENHWKQNQKPQSEPEEDFDFNQLEQEDFPDGKKLAKAFNQVTKKLSGYEAKLAEKEQKILMLETLQELPDFKEIVTPENVEKYIKSDEDHLEAVQKATNPLRKVYNLIKKDARYQAEKASKSKSPSQEQVRLEKKEASPKTGSGGVQSRAISYAAATSYSKMTREQKNALWAETQAAARR